MLKDHLHSMMMKKIELNRDRIEKGEEGKRNENKKDQQIKIYSQFD